MFQHVIDGSTHLEDATRGRQFGTIHSATQAFTTVTLLARGTFSAGGSLHLAQYFRLLLLRHDIAIREVCFLLVVIFLAVQGNRRGAALMARHLLDTDIAIEF